MELIASSRIIKAQRRVEAARPYAEKMRELMASVAQERRQHRPPAAQGPREGRDQVGMIVITADRGLAGAYNSNVIRAAERDMRDARRAPSCSCPARRRLSYFKFRGYDIADSWQGYSDQPRIEDAREVAQGGGRGVRRRARSTRSGSPTRSSNRL